MLIIRRRRRPSRRDEEEYVSFPTEGGGNPLIDALQAIVAGPEAVGNLAAGTARVIADLVRVFSPVANHAAGLAQRIGDFPFPNVSPWEGDTNSAPRIERTPADRPEQTRGRQRLDPATPET